MKNTTILFTFALFALLVLTGCDLFAPQDDDGGSSSSLSSEASSSSSVSSISSSSETSSSSEGAAVTYDIIGTWYFYSDDADGYIATEYQDVMVSQTVGESVFTFDVTSVDNENNRIIIFDENESPAVYVAVYWRNFNEVDGTVEIGSTDQFANRADADSTTASDVIGWILHYDTLPESSSSSSSSVSSSQPSVNGTITIGNATVTELPDTYTQGDEYEITIDIPYTYTGETIIATFYLTLASTDTVGPDFDDFVVARSRTSYGSQITDGADTSFQGNDYLDDFKYLTDYEGPVYLYIVAVVKPDLNNPGDEISIPGTSIVRLSPNSFNLDRIIGEFMLDDATVSGLPASYTFGDSLPVDIDVSYSYTGDQTTNLIYILGYESDTLSFEDIAYTEPVLFGYLSSDEGFQINNGDSGTPTYNYNFQNLFLFSSPGSYDIYFYVVANNAAYEANTANNVVLLNNTAVAVTIPSLIPEWITVEVAGGTEQGTAVSIDANLDAWITSTFADGSAQWYSFSVTDGEEYTLYIDDSYQGSGNYTGDIEVNIRNADGTSDYIEFQDSAYPPQADAASFTATATETVFIEVSPYNLGTFAIGIETP